MKENEILEKAVAKAVKNGYQVHKYIIKQYEERGWTDQMKIFKYEIIFSHEFAKSFWGESKCDCMETPHGILHKDKCKEVDWQQHLQQMVLKKNYLLYLEKFL